jgi:hypothetical protein
MRWEYQTAPATTTCLLSWRSPPTKTSELLINTEFYDSKVPLFHEFLYLYWLIKRKGS